MGVRKALFQENEYRTSQQGKSAGAGAEHPRPNCHRGSPRAEHRARTEVSRKARDYKVVYREHLNTLDLMKQAEATTTNESEESRQERKKKNAAFEKHHYSILEKEGTKHARHRAAVDINTMFIKES